MNPYAKQISVFLSDFSVSLCVTFPLIKKFHIGKEFLHLHYLCKTFLNTEEIPEEISEEIPEEIMKTYKRYTITAALPYANGPIHLGHLAGVYVPADIYTRYLRLKGEDVLYICGSDEHGIPITIKARQEGVSPQEVVDRYHTLNKESFVKFGISFNIYSRTTSPVHYEVASGFFRKLYDKGEFTESLQSNIMIRRLSTFWPTVI